LKKELNLPLKELIENRILNGEIGADVQG
jgi:hypothetical protein